MVIGIVGIPGSGKTYYATEIALEHLNKGVQVFSNYYIEGATMYDDLETVLFDVQKRVQNEYNNFVKGGGMFYDFKPCPVTIIVDEINLVCPARYWDSFNPKLAYFWSQSRKLGLTLLWTAQHQDRVDKIVREITNFIWVCKEYDFTIKYKRKDKQIFNIHRSLLYDILKVDSVKARPIITNWFKIKSKVWKKYSTYFMIKLPDRIVKGFNKKRW